VCTFFCQVRVVICYVDVAVVRISISYTTDLNKHALVVVGRVCVCVCVTVGREPRGYVIVVLLVTDRRFSGSLCRASLSSMSPLAGSALIERVSCVRLLLAAHILLSNPLFSVVAFRSLFPRRDDSKGVSLGRSVLEPLPKCSPPLV
jgi:hypothetical protein